MEMLPDMAKFLVENKGMSIISRIYGVYQVKYKGMAPTFLML